MNNPNYAEIVSEAAKTLDKKAPGWHREIHRGRLNMQFSCDCICGQVSDLSDHDDRDESMGFCLSRDSVNDPDREEQWENLTQLWLTEIDARLEADARQADKSADAFIARTNEIINLPALVTDTLPVEVSK